jgi:hypothetical protein
LADDIGVRKKPSEERGPKDISEIKQPKPMINNGVRHVDGAVPNCAGEIRLLLLVMIASIVERVPKEGRP